jgi:predicted nucleotidyltransferase
MKIDEALLYHEDHHERCLELIQRYFQENQNPSVQAVYALGSVVTGDFLPGYSDIDILIITNDADQTTLIHELRELNEKLLVPTFHLFKPADFPPPDLYLRVRLLSESKLLYGDDLIKLKIDIPVSELHEQLFSSLSLRLVMLRSLCCSKALDKYSPGYTVYYAQKLCLFGLRALFMKEGEYNTQRRNIIERVKAKNMLTSKNSTFFSSLLVRLAQHTYPQTLEERLAILLSTVNFLEEIQLLFSTRTQIIG